MTAKPHGRALTVADGGAAKLIRQRCSFAGVAEERLSQSVPQEETNLLFGWSSDVAETGEILRDTWAYLQISLFSQSDRIRLSRLREI